MRDGIIRSGSGIPPYFPSFPSLMLNLSRVGYAVTAASAGVELHHHGIQVVKVRFQPVRKAEFLPRVHFGLVVLRFDGNESHESIHYRKAIAFLLAD